MSQFALPTVESFKYLRGEEVKNKAVNLSLCISIEKGRFNCYPDNKGRPSIVFRFMQGSKEHWVYDREEDRDQDFDQLIEVHQPHHHGDTMTMNIDIAPEHTARRQGADKGLHPEVIAAYRYVDSVLDFADAASSKLGGPLWSGWALREAFLAGCSHAARSEQEDNQ